MRVYEWVTTEDEYGIYKRRTNEHGILEELITRKQKWHDENPPIPEEPQPPTAEDRIESLEREKMSLQIAFAESIEKQEIDKVNSQIALAEVIETLIIKGVL